MYSDPTFFPGRAATIHYRTRPVKTTGLAGIKEDIKSVFHAKDDLKIGCVGILHPTVLEKFEIPYPCSALEFTLEPFKM